jgi:hypothetical protein
LNKLQTGASASLKDIFVVQVTNSNLDLDTRKFSTSYPGSQLVVTKFNWSGRAGEAPTLDSSYNTTSAQVVLATDATDSANKICIQPADVLKNRIQSCGGTANELPTSARPIGTPTIVLRSDGLGFQVITGWYDITQQQNNCSGQSFDYGTSYITVHEFGAFGDAGGAVWYQLAGIEITNTALSGMTFVGGGLFVDGINPNSMPSSMNIGESFSNVQQILNNPPYERYSRTSWSERLE